MPYLEHQPIDFFPRNLLQDEIVDPRMAMRRVFEEDLNLPATHKYLEKWLVAVFYDRRPLGRKMLVVIMALQESILRLVEAAHLLHLEDPALRKEMPMTVMKGAGLPEPALYCGDMHEHGYTAWDYFPRHLTRKEFIDPYRVFRKIARYKQLPEWRDVLQYFFSAAVSGERIYECYEDENVYITCQLLMKLVEAAYLVKVREV